MKKLIVAGIVSGLMATAALAQPCGGPGQGPGGQGPQGKQHMMGEMMLLQRLAHNPEMAKQAGLTDEDLAALSEIRYATEKQMIALRSQQELLRLDMQQKMEAATPDKAAIMALIDQVGAGETAIKKLMVGTMLDVKARLGAEKVAQLKEFGKKMRAERQGGRDGRDGRDGRNCKQRGDKGDKGGKGGGHCPMMQGQPGPRGAPEAMPEAGPVEDAPAAE